MKLSQPIHSFHIPVMGLAFTIDSPIRVAHYGISSVISIIDDELMEKMNALYSKKFNFPYQEISKKEQDYRAKRITSYLNLVREIVNFKFSKFKTELSENTSALKKLITILPNQSNLKAGLSSLLAESPASKSTIASYLENHLIPGEIDVNIMTKVDKTNYFQKEELPSEFNDAHAGLRGFAQSDLESSVIFSAGMNPRLYGYIAKFDDFFPDKNGRIKKKIVLKVSDYRSAVIQGKFLAKKGLWVSEYRIESGLNCGGHAFATNGFLMGPILAEFRDRRQELIDEIFEVCKSALSDFEKIVPTRTLPVKITAQGGVATSEEHEFLIAYYNLDSVGWGTPFLLVPEVTNVDKDTLIQLKKAKEKDLYLSNVSPLGVPFNNLRNSSKDIETLQKVEDGNPGSPCPRKYLALSNEYGTEGVCTASRLFQKNKIEEQGISNAITEKACLCMGLSSTAIINYGRANVIERTDRPNMFINELEMYLKYLSNKIEEHKSDWGKKSEKYLNAFTTNMNDGIAYYQSVFSSVGEEFGILKEGTIPKLNIVNLLTLISNAILSDCFAFDFQSLMNFIIIYFFDLI